MIDYSSLDDEEFENIFAYFAHQYSEQASIHYFYHTMTAVPAAGEIIQMGERAIPHILHWLRIEPAMMWSALLIAITGQDTPVKPEKIIGVFGCYNMDQVVSAWSAWGRENGYIK